MDEQKQASTPEPAEQSANQPAATTPPAAAKGYGSKRPVWQWVLIYVVVAIVVYGLIYYLFIHKSGTSSGY